MIALEPTAPHVPVMLEEVLSAIPAAAKNIVDGTFGAGGYSRAILEKNPKIQLYAIDRDPTVLPFVEQLKKDYPKLTFVQGCFGDMHALLTESHLVESGTIDVIILDIGVSSMQIDQADRGFSFRFDGALDMRMEGENHSQSAADIVNTYQEKDLADIIYKYGEERLSRRIAKAIVNARKETPITRTMQLADIIRKAVPFSKQDKKNKIDPATRTFQALRIYVNDELGELQRALVAGEKLLAPDGHLIIVTFHSLEDSIVKNFFKTRSGNASGGSRYLPDISPTGQSQPTFRLPKPKYLAATPAETSRNPRARSAKLRYAIRTTAPTWKEAA